MVGDGLGDAPDAASEADGPGEGDSAVAGALEGLGDLVGLVGGSPVQARTIRAVASTTPARRFSAKYQICE